MAGRIVSGLTALVLVLWLSALTYASKEEILALIHASEIHPADLALIHANKDQLSEAQLRNIADFLLNPLVFAERRHFDVREYSSWDDYNFHRPQALVALTNLARRDLFLDPARQLNNPALTNMSAEALAALAFSQTYVEEKWDHTVPWDGDSNASFNWIQPELLDTPTWEDYVAGDFLFRERVRYWFATFEPSLLRDATEEGLSLGDDIQAALAHIRAPVPNVPRLAGYSYPIGNQLYLQTAETLLWYADYGAVSAERYGIEPSAEIDTAIEMPQDSQSILAMLPPADWQYPDIPGLYGLLYALFAEDLRRELSHPEMAAFWNVMRFVHAGARQREGGGSVERPGDHQPAIMALRYAERSATPRGRSRQDVSAFALITTVYSDSILLDFTNWDPVTGDLIVQPLDTSRSDGIHRRLSERNKAIYVIEQMGNEAVYSNATHISGSRGLGLNLTTKYELPQGDFLPYTPDEAYFLVSALALEATVFDILESNQTLCESPLLNEGYELYLSQSGIDAPRDSRIEAICQR